MENSKFTLRKIELKMMIDTLVKVYNSGADFIDIEGNLGDSQDTLHIVVHPEYMAEKEEEDIVPDLSDDDLNQLI